MNTDIFSNRTLLELRDCPFQFIQIKITMLKDLNLNDVLKNYRVIINGKNFYNQAIDSDIK